MTDDAPRSLTIETDQCDGCLRERPESECTECDCGALLCGECSQLLGSHAHAEAIESGDPNFWLYRAAHVGESGRPCENDEPCRPGGPLCTPCASRALLRQQPREAAEARC